MIGTKKIRRLFIVLVLILSAAFLYRYSPYKIEFLGHYDKILAHRVNSKEKLKSSINFFSGIELDLVYLEAKGVFDVNHPPAVSIGLQLDDYMSGITDNFKPFLWLDIKNLEPKNSDKILERLLEIFSKYDFPRDRILVETQRPKALGVFNDAGFLTSYYLPHGLAERSPLELKQEVDLIATILNKQPHLAISSSYKDYQIMNTYFPKKSKYLWMTDGILSHGISYPRKILKDEKVKALVVRFKSFNGNR
jgi:hypothetical protein